MKATMLKALIVIAMMGTAGALVLKSNAPATNPTIHLTRKQLARLLDTPNTPEGHHELARYFRQEAQRNRDKEQFYREMAETYRLHPPRVDVYRNESIQARYMRLADQARNQALGDEQLAIFQDNIAMGLANTK